MKRETILMATFFALLAFAGVAWGNNSPEPQVFSQDQMQDQTQDQQQQQTNEQDQQQDQANSQQTNIKHKYPRQTPMAHVGASNNTADMIVCFSLSGSGKAGAGGGIWCRLQGDLYAEHRANDHFIGGRYGAAAKARCSRKAFRKDFDDLADCKAQMVQSYISMEIDQAGMSQEEYETFIQAQKSSYERDIERLTNLLDEATGLKK